MLKETAPRFTPQAIGLGALSLSEAFTERTILVRAQQEIVCLLSESMLLSTLRSTCLIHTASRPIHEVRS